MHQDQDFYRVIAVQAPVKQRNNILTLLITLENMKGEQKTKNIEFTSDSLAYEFYKTQMQILENRKKKDNFCFTIQKFNI